ncbi:MAG: hypothetical protein R3F31_24230 [Verrucomicrobiales bacterium]
MSKPSRTSGKSLDEIVREEEEQLYCRKALLQGREKPLKDPKVGAITCCTTTNRCLW